MAEDTRIVVIGEDAHMIRRDLLVRFGPDRVLNAPISESAFVGAAVAAAMAGLRPVVEVYMVDFLTVCMDALVNHAAKLSTFSGGKWTAPLVVRAPCGGGYGDGGQHEQALWGWLAHIPGLAVVIPSNPADAGGLMTAALEHDGPILFLEHKLLSETWLEFLGRGGRATVDYDVPSDGTRGPVPDSWEPLALGAAATRREGSDITIASVGVGVHRSIEAAGQVAAEGVSVHVIDLRTISPLDRTSVIESVRRTGRLRVVDEDYQSFGLSGELAAIALEAGLTFRFSRVCTDETIPYSHRLEQQVLPNVERIANAIMQMMQSDRQGSDGR
jgi:pyruvate dehydrogenase E1 component beta subunit